MNTSKEQISRRQLALEVAAQLLSTLSSDQDSLQTLIEILARELNCRRVSLLWVNWEEGVLEMKAALGLPLEIISEVRPRIGEGIAGSCARLGKPLFIDDHSRLEGSDLREFIPDGHDLGAQPMSLTVPILLKGQVIGVVNVTHKVDEEPFSRQDINFISALMGHAGYLLENAALLGHLKAQRAFSEQVIDTVSDPLVVVDRKFRLLACNLRFRERFGAQPGQLLWESLPLSKSQQKILKAALSGPVRAEQHLDWKLGGRLFDLRISPFREQQYLLFFADISERRQLERRLLSAEKMASLGILAAGVGHEINNPISYVKSNLRHAEGYFDDLLQLIEAWRSAAQNPQALHKAQNLERCLELNELREDVSLMLKEMKEGVTRVERIVSGLRSFAHPDSSTASQADLQELLERAILLTESKWKYKLEIKRSFSSCAIYCLPNQLEQVFINLIVNAAQAAKGWGELEIISQKLEEGILIIFRDDCGGIPVELQSRIFEPFFTTKDIGEGTGLGLSISYNIIEAHGGKMSVESDQIGSRFLLELPLGEADRPLVVKQRSSYRA